MTLTFAQPASFVVEWRRLRLSDEDLAALESLILERPQAGAVMQGTGGMRKVQFAPPSWHRGKSGAVRVCYVLFPDAGYCYLLMLFAKNERPNLSAAQKERAKKIIADLRSRHMGD